MYSFTSNFDFEPLTVFQTPWLSIKVVTFRNNKGKHWFSHETGLVFMHGSVFKDGSRNSAIFKLELFATIGNSKAYNQWTVVFACCCSKSTVSKGKIKIG